jgi:hypothetical protein
MTDSRLARLVVALLTVTSLVGVVGAAPTAGPTAAADLAPSHGPGHGGPAVTGPAQTDGVGYVGAVVRLEGGTPVTTAGTGVTVDVLDENGTVVARALRIQSDGRTRKVAVPGGEVYRTRLNCTAAPPGRFTSASARRFVAPGGTQVVPVTAVRRPVATDLRVVDVSPADGVAYADGDERVTLTVRAVDTLLPDTPPVANTRIRIDPETDTPFPDALGFPDGEVLTTNANGTVTFAVTSTRAQTVRFRFSVPAATVSDWNVDPATVEVGALARLEGTVRDADGTVVGDATVRIVRTTAFGDGAPGPSLADPVVVAETTASDDGAYSATVRPDATYRIEAETPASGAVTATGSSVVTVDGRSRHRVSVTVSSTGDDGGDDTGTGDDTDGDDDGDGGSVDGGEDGATDGNGTGNGTDADGDPVQSPAPVVDGQPPTDPDGDGIYEDLTGDGRVTVLDVATLLKGLDGPAVAESPSAFDVDGSGDVSILDVAALLAEL